MLPDDWDKKFDDWGLILSLGLTVLIVWAFVILVNWVVAK